MDTAPDAQPAQAKPSPFSSPDFLRALRRHRKLLSQEAKEASKRLRQERAETLRRVSRWRLKNPERQQALTAVAVALKNFEIERGSSCSRCGSERNIVAGPISLDPLRVRWVCRRCSNAMRRQAPPITERARHAAPAHRQRQLFGRAEAARIAERQFWIRVERAAMIIARTGADTAVACRAVGLHSAKAQKAVQGLCDQRGIARRYFWGFPHWRTSTPHPVTVNRHRKEIVRQRDEGESG
jgi:hypothetical protein